MTRRPLPLLLAALVVAPAVAAADTVEPAPAAQVATPEVVASGTWEQAHCAISGGWRIEQEGDQLFIVLDDQFTTTKAPDLKLFLSPKPMSEMSGREAVKGVRIAKLAGPSGAQRFALPAGTDLADFESVVLVCQAFKKLWGGAAL